jgi:cobalamin-dependent methionine synthase I
MLLVGEKINILNPVVYDAVMTGDETPILDLAERQLSAGAEALDINLGPGRETGGRLPWLAEKLATRFPDAPLFLSANLACVIDALKTAVPGGRAVINASTADPETLKRYVAAAVSLGCGLVIMLLKKGALPSDPETSCLIGEEVLEEVERQGLSPDSIFLDPVLRATYDLRIPSFSKVSDTGKIINSLLLVQNLRSGKIRTIVGLSNIFQGYADNRQAGYHRALLTLLRDAGLSAAILNPLDRALMERLREDDNMLDGPCFSHEHLAIRELVTPA